MDNEEIQGVKFSQFPSETPGNADEVVGLHAGDNARFSIANIIAAIRQGLANLFVPLTRKINNKALSSDITLDASDVGAVDASDVGVADGVASLDSNGKVPSSQLPTISSDAADITYDPTTSGASATNVQDALDEAFDDLDGKQDSITASGILKGDGQGGVSAATAGTDYQEPLAAGTDYATPAQLADKANQSQLAYVETGTTASRAYAEGEYFCWNGLLYRVTTAISSGGTFTPGTNCEQTTVSNLAEYWLDVTSQFSTVSGATLKVLVNPAIRKVKLFFLGDDLPNGSNVVTIPTQYAPDTSKLVYVSSTDSYRIGIFHGRFTQTPSSFSNIYDFHSFLRYYSGNRQVAVYYPISNPAYAVTFDIEYVY